MLAQLEWWTWGNSFFVLSYRVRRHTSEYLRSVAQAGVVLAPAPDLAGGTLRRIRAEARLHATAPLHAIWLVSALLHEDHRLSATAHHHATIGKRPDSYKPV